MLNKHAKMVSIDAKKWIPNHSLSDLTARFNLAGELLVESAQGELLDADNSIAFLKEQGHLNETIATVWVPSPCVILTEVFVPGKRKIDWMTALPYALEESLSEPVENFHFVALNRTKEGLVSVAIVEHKWMTLWIDTLQSMGLGHAKLIPDCFRVPFEQSAQSEDEKTAMVMIQQNDATYVRTGLYSGFTADENWLNQFQSVANANGQSHGLTTLDSSLLLSSQLAINPSLAAYNLRTDDYQAQSKNLQYWKDWRWPALFVLFILMTSLLSTWMKTQSLNEKIVHYQMQTEQLFKEMFPDVKRVINIRMQTQTRLNGEDDPQNRALSPIKILQEIEPLFKAEPEVSIKKIQWRADSKGGRLQVTVEAKQTSQLQMIVTMSQKKNLSANVVLELKNVTPTLVEGVFNVSTK